MAQRLAERLGFEERVIVSLGQLHERWGGSDLPAGPKGEAISPAIRVVTRAQDAVTFHRIGGSDAAVAMAQERRGAAYDPRLIDLFCAGAECLLAESADLKSPFSLGHSPAIARLAASSASTPRSASPPTPALPSSRSRTTC